jgi:hypothetical protein
MNTIENTPIHVEPAADSLDEKGGALDRTSRLSALLRKIGAAVLLAAALTFLVQRWEGLAHVERYFSFLGYTVLLAAAGFFCGLRIKEDKGARTFLAIAAATIPAHFCQLGGFVYYRVLIREFSPSAIALRYPGFLHLTVGSDVMAALTLIAGIAVLVPVMLIAFSALMRSEARRLTIAYTLANAVLLIPVREPGWVALFAGMLLLAVSHFDLTVLRKNPAMKSTEGTLVRCMMAAPVALMIGRTVLYYADVTYVFGSAVLAIVAAFQFAYAPYYTESEVLAGRLQKSGACFALWSWYNFSIGLAYDLRLSADTAFLMHTLPLSLILAALSFGMRKDADKMQRAAAAIAGVAAVYHLLAFPGIAASLLCIGVSIPLAAFGFVGEHRKTFVLGMIGVAAGLLYNVKTAILELSTVNPWIGLALLGTVTLIASSYIERNSEEIKARIGIIRKKFATAK